MSHVHKSAHLNIKPPERVRGMTNLNRKLFETELSLACLRVNRAKLSEVLQHLKKYALKVPCLKFIQQTEGCSDTGILLNPESVSKWSDIGEGDREMLVKHSVTEANFENTSVNLDYDNFQASDIFRAVLPKEIDGFSSFSQIGHIVHLNLREHLLPYKNLIAQVLLDKVPKTRTVVNKLDVIDNTYRNFEMEVLCGENDMLVKICENKCVYEFDFSKVYWNPRLCTEHERIVEMLKPGDALFDVFAGVGPFSIPAAKKKCHVFANDLNPESFRWLNHNIKKNKIAQGQLQTFNKDGRDFILNELKAALPQFLSNSQNVYIVMNLPALASEFLNAFDGLYASGEVDLTKPPLVQVYCFAKGEDYIGITKDLIVTHFGRDISNKIVEIFRVRTVSNFKEMMRVTLKLDAEILMGSRKRKIEPVEIDLKKC